MRCINKRWKASPMKSPVRVEFLIEEELIDRFRLIENARGRTTSEGIRDLIKKECDKGKALE